MGVFRSLLFRKLLISAFSLIAVTLLALDFPLTNYISEREKDSVRARLTGQARVIAGEISEAPRARLEEWAKDVGARAQARVTVIDPQGVVFADSQHDPETMENHANRPEILQAKTGGVGVSIRHSATLDQDLCYVALSVQYQGAAGFILRLAVPLQQLDTAVAAVRRQMFEASLIALGLAMLIAYFFSERFAKRIRQLQVFAENLVQAPESKDIEPDSNDELGSLARSLNRMAAELRDSLDRLSLEGARREAILSSMVEGVLAVDGEMRVTFCNGSFLREIAASGPIQERKPLIEVVRDVGLCDMLTQALALNQPQRKRLELPAAKGHSFEVQTAPLAVSSKRGVIAVLHDITDLERLERVRKDFVANVSHELRTPLAAILGYAETLIDGAVEDPANNRKFLEIIRSHATRLNNIASDLLTLSELESGKPERIENEYVAVGTVIESAIGTVEAEARARGIQVKWQPSDEILVWGSKLRLEQALVNLLTNAVKFNRPSGDVRIEVARTAENQARITITDSGIGIPSEDLPRIFERFYRVDKVRSREVGGTGLGLSIVKHIIEGMNGAITVESTLGKGTVFSITLPSCPAN